MAVLIGRNPVTGRLTQVGGIDPGSAVPAPSLLGLPASSSYLDDGGSSGVTAGNAAAAAAAPPMLWGGTLAPPPASWVTKPTDIPYAPDPSLLLAPPAAPCSLWCQFVGWLHSIGL
jgi:hypothetical protein